MMRIVCLSLITCFLFSCKTEKNIPDVSKIQVELATKRFEKDFFALDTNKLDAEIQQLYAKYPQFSIDFFQNILGSNPQPDSIMQNVRLFSNAYKNVYIETQKVFENVTNEEKQIKQGFQFVKYYFPSYQLPTKLITYVGPWDASFMLSDNSTISAVFRDREILGIGLQLSLGKDFPIYQNQHLQEFYPNYISKKFDKEYIPINALKVIVDDIYPQQKSGKTLIEQMIEAGKRLYLLDAFLPNIADTLKTGYTAAQLKGCYANEANIWSFFVTNDLVFASEPALIKDYLTDGPKTTVLGDASPGFIGQFVGWQIVKKWMSKTDKTSLQQLLKTPAKQIFEESKYKP